eukprot:gene7907-12375_t
MKKLEYKIIKNDSKNQKITISSYNQLANSLGEEEHFKYVEPKYLNPTYREKQNLNLIKQLKQNSLDILVIVECDNYWTFWNKELNLIGYSSVYSKRPTFRNDDLNLKSGWHTSYKYDGIGIFFDSQRFELVYEPITVMHTDGHDRISLISFLFDSLSKKYFFVIGIHCYWNSQKVEDQIKELNETNLATSQLIEKYSKDLKIEYKIPVVFAGDFNNVPNSNVYKFMQSSFLKKLNYKMRSSYDIYSSTNLNEFGANYEPNHTTVNFKRCETIDYIWYSSDLLNILELLKIPDEDELTTEDGPIGWKDKINSNCVPRNGIPNSQYSSDHLILQAKFEIKP